MAHARPATVFFPIPVLAILAIAFGPSPVRAQDTPESEDAGWRVGASLGLPGARAYGYFPAFTFGVHFTWLAPRSPGADLSVGTAPYLLALGAAKGGLPLGARGSLTYPLRVDSMLVLPVAGLSFVGGANGSSSGGGFGGTWGPHLGLTTVAVNGFRLGLTVHWLRESTEPVWLMEWGYQPAPRR